MMSLRTVAKIVPPGWRSKALAAIKREYRLGWPAALTNNPDSDLDLLDTVLAHYSRRNPRIHFLQVGACDGVMGDPLSPLIEPYGLTGVLVEPRLRMFEQLKRNYAQRFSTPGRFTFVNAAIAEKDGTAKLYSMKPTAGGADWLAGTASFDRKLLLQTLASFPDPESLIEVEEVKTATFDTLFSTYDIAPVHLLQIDAEGFDAELLKLFDIGRRKPAIVRFEHLHLKPQEYESALEMLIEHGYKIALSQHDTLGYLPAE
jgi:FkbM family methyltransferase